MADRDLVAGLDQTFLDQGNGLGIVFDQQAAHGLDPLEKR
jgi:hypothetical protein